MVLSPGLHGFSSCCNLERHLIKTAPMLKNNSHLTGGVDMSKTQSEQEGLNDFLTGASTIHSKIFENSHEHYICKKASF